MNVSSGIKGIDKHTLWSAWKEIRQQLKRAPRRDVLDFLEYDIDPDVWINRLLLRLKKEEYSPERPIRYPLAKSKGFNRIITIPAIPDLVLYRTIVDYLYLLGSKSEVQHAYFSQSTLSKVSLQAEAEAKKTIQLQKIHDQSPYTFSSKGAFYEWLRFDQYRKYLIFDRVYPYVVITDISNYFDSILYSRVEETLHGLKAPAQLVPLLFLLLENLSIREAFSPVQRIGLPVDPCDCSRVLAHMVLFTHDHRMVKLVGSDAYVRWMDDLNIGVDDKASGLKVLSKVCDSLRRLHLTPNVSKSRILNLAEAKRHFHFSANADLGKIEKMPHKTGKDRKALRAALRISWKEAVKLEGFGEWQKILKRYYRQAARARSRKFVRRARSDVLNFPGLIERITDYIRYVCSAAEAVSFVEALLNDDEQIYPDVNYQLIECLLKLYPDAATAREIRQLATDILNNKVEFSGVNEAKVLAPLLLLRYGDGRQLRFLQIRLERDAEHLSPEVIRSLCAVVSGSRARGFSAVEATASRLLRNHLSEFVKLVMRIRKFDSVPGRFKNRVKLSHDSIIGAKYVDMRALLSARILGLCGHKAIVDWLYITKKNLLSQQLTDFDVRLIEKHWPKSTHGA